MTRGKQLTGLPAGLGWMPVARPGWKLAGGPDWIADWSAGLVTAIAAGSLAAPAAAGSVAPPILFLLDPLSKRQGIGTVAGSVGGAIKEASNSHGSLLCHLPRRVPGGTEKWARRRTAQCPPAWQLPQ